MKNWLVQSSGLRRTPAMIKKLLNDIQEGGSSWKDFGIPTNTTSITNWQNFPEVDSYFLSGSTKALSILTDDSIDATEIFVGADKTHAENLVRKIRNGIFYDHERFDMAFYKWHVGRHLLNRDCDIITLGELMDMSFDTPKFVKPTSDLKLFDGGVIPANVKFRDYLNTIKYHCTLNSNMGAKVVVANCTKILAEWRFFVTGNRVRAGSQYRKNGEMNVSKQIPYYVWEAARRLQGVYQPAKCFTMDLCMTDDLQIKIVEYNCINCSGFYEADVSSLAFELGWL